MLYVPAHCPRYTLLQHGKCLLWQAVHQIHADILKACFLCIIYSLLSFLYRMNTPDIFQQFILRRLYAETYSVYSVLS